MLFPHKPGWFPPGCWLTRRALSFSYSMSRRAGKENVNALDRLCVNGCDAAGSKECVLKSVQEV